MKRSRKFVFAISLCFFLLVLLAFPFGPLFPWSPVKPGYHTTNFARGELYSAAGQPVEADYALLDHLMAEAENFHQMHFSRRIKVIACKDWATCERGVPWLSMHSLGGVMLAGDVIYITPKLKEKNFSTAEFLRHELSHALLTQNTTLLKGYRLNWQPWFYEGLAVSFGRQHDYLSRTEVLEKISTVAVVQYLDPAQAPAEWNARLAYPLQRYFIEWLKATYSAERFQDFLTRNLAAPDDWRATFAAVYQFSFTEAAASYEKALRAGTWLPVAE